MLAFFWAALLKMSVFYPTLNFGLFWAALSKMSVFHPTRNYRQFWADPTFSAVRSTLLAEEEAQNVEFFPTRNFGHFPPWSPFFDVPKCH